MLLRALASDLCFPRLPETCYRYFVQQLPTKVACGECLAARLHCAGIVVAVAPVSAKIAIIAAIATAPVIIFLLLCYTDGLQFVFIILYGLAIMRFELEKK